MNIDHSRELLYDYARGRLSEQDRTIVEEQLLGSEELRQELDRVKSYYAAIDEIDPVPVPEHFLKNVHQRIDSRTKKSLLNRLLFPLHLKLPIEFAGVAVTVVLVIFLFIPQLKKKNYSEYEPLPVDNVQQVSTASQDEAPEKKVTAAEKTTDLGQMHTEKKIVSVSKDNQTGSLVEQQPKSSVPKKLKPSFTNVGVKKVDDESALPTAERLSEIVPAPAPTSAPARQLVEENDQINKSEYAAATAPVVQENELSKAFNKSEEQTSEDKRKVVAFEQKRMKSRSAHSEKSDAKEMSSSMDLETTAVSNDIIVLLAKYRMKLIVKEFTGHTSNCSAAGTPAAVASFLREIKGVSDVTLLKVVPENYSAALDSVVVEFSVKGKVE